MQFRVNVPGVEVAGNMLQFTVSSFRMMPSVALGYFVKFGLISTQQGGKLELAGDAWYPLDRWLHMFEAIYREVGPTTTSEVGRQTAESFPLPPHIQSIVTLLPFIDVGYHSNHRLNGRGMFDMSTGAMLEGIGHYKVDITPEKRRAVTVCDNPYPCEFDLGLIAAAGARFEPKALTTHEAGSPCRAKGADSCTYITTW